MIATRNNGQDGGRAASDEPIVLIVVPPFQGLKCPALGASQLKANLLRAGIPCEVLYLNLLFAERITPHVSEWLSGTGPLLLGEFLFSHVAHELTDEDLQRYVKEIVEPSDFVPAFERFFPGESIEQAVRGLVDQARDFIQGQAIDEIRARNPWMVGFSSTFQANCCSIATIKQIKKVAPELRTVIGGANCETVMGQALLSLYPEIDFVGRGECDRTFVQLIEDVRSGGDGSGITGFLVRGDAEPPPQSAPLNPADLDEQAYPDFDDYFDMLGRVAYREQVNAGLAMETSRGCWWGYKQHCTFCAFNREGMIFRSKKPARVLAEMEFHVARYGVRRMEMTDNILDMGYFRSLLPELADQPVADLFWETKANMTRDQVRMLADARVNWIQPGIESLSDLTLKLMKKGSTGIQNVQLLKWTTESGIRITWNWLYGFPGEDEGEMDRMADMVDRIHHLQPASSSPVIYLERFSPYHMTPEEWELGSVRPAKAYYHVYPFDDESVENMAFFFECEYFSTKEQSAAHGRLKDIVARWNWAYPTSHLVAIPRKGALWIFDTRPGKTRRLHKLTGLHRRVYEYMFKARGARDVVKALTGEATPDEVTTALKSLVDDKLLLESNGRYLGLATDPRMSYKRFPEVFPGGEFVRASEPTLGDRLKQVIKRPSSARAVARDTVMDWLLGWLAGQPMRDEIGGADRQPIREREQIRERVPG